MFFIYNSVTLSSYSNITKRGYCKYINKSIIAALVTRRRQVLALIVFQAAFVNIQFNIAYDETK